MLLALLTLQQYIYAKAVISYQQTFTKGIHAMYDHLYCMSFTLSLNMQITKAA